MGVLHVGVLTLSLIQSQNAMSASSSSLLQDGKSPSLLCLDNQLPEISIAAVMNGTFHTPLCVCVCVCVCVRVSPPKHVNLTLKEHIIIIIHQLIILHTCGTCMITTFNPHILIFSATRL